MPFKNGVFGKVYSKHCLEHLGNRGIYEKRTLCLFISFLVPASQDIMGSDGIWDHAYVIDADNRDNYPLVEPWSLPETMDELKSEIEELWSQGEIDNQGIFRSLIAKLNTVQKLVDKGKIDEAKGILLEDFIPQVQSLSGIHITVEAAYILIKSAEYKIANL